MMKVKLYQIKSWTHEEGVLKDRSRRLYLGAALLLAITSFSFIWASSSTFAWRVEKTANLTGTQLSGGGTNLNVSTKTALAWDSNQKYDDSYFSYSSGSNTRLTIDTAGDYLVSLTLPITSDSTVISNRNGIEAEVRVNGVKQDVGIGRSTYVRNDTSHNESSAHLAILLKDLSATDYIEVYVASNTSETSNTLTSDTHSIYAEYVEDSTVFSATGTQTTNGTDLNSTTPYEMQWSAQTRSDSGYTHSTSTSSEDITLDTAGNYFVSVNIPLSSSVQRPSVKGRVLLDGTVIDGGIFQQGYIRNVDGHSTASIHYSGVVTAASTNQIISVSTQLEAATGTVTVGGEKATIYVEKLPSNLVYQAEATELMNGQIDWNPSSPTAISWGTDNVIDSTIYSHSTSSNANQITINESGDYLIALNVPVTGSFRHNPNAKVHVNNSVVTGLEAKSGYIRDIDNHNESSLTLTGLLADVNQGDVLEIKIEQEAGSGTASIEGAASLMLWKKTVGASMTQTSHRWYQDNQSLTPTRPLANENSPLTLIKNSYFSGPVSTVRLRLGLTTGIYDLPAGEDRFKLQYGSGSNPSSISNWTDVGNGSGSGEDWVYSGEGWPAGWTYRKPLAVNNSITSTIDKQILTSADDAEENTSTGAVDITSSDLKMINDSVDQEVGLRFQDLGIPQGATITNAWVQFTTDEQPTDATSLALNAHDTDNAPAFTTTTNDITSRIKTSSSVTWNSIPVWDTYGESGPDQQTPDITSLVQEVVDRPGWSSGNALAFIISGFGKRVAHAYDGIPDSAPKLHIEYESTDRPDLVNFPVLVSITGDTDLANDAQADFDDVMFMDDGGTKLDHEFEHYDSSTGGLTAWVKVPSLSVSGETQLYMYYGNSVAADKRNPTGVWQNGFGAVWHMNQDPSVASIVDSAGNGYDGTSNGTMTSEDLVAGRIGDSLDFDGVDDYVHIAQNPPLLEPGTDDFALSLWFKSSEALGTFVGDSNYAYNSFGIHHGSPDGEVKATLKNDATESQATSDTPLLDDNAWHHIVANYDRDEHLTLYVDGQMTEFTNISADSAYSLAPTGSYRIGGGNEPGYLLGSLDEVRHMTTVRSPEWVATEYSNQSDPSSFITVGAEETTQNGSTLPSTLLTGADTAGSYVLSNPTISTPTTITAGDMGEWDFVLNGAGAQLDTVYYFRLVSTNGNMITYSSYPAIEVVKPSTNTQMRGGTFFNQGREQPFTF